MITIAYYLGQYQPLEENNRFWGDGFTEWHNVAKARPLYPGHMQPVLPGSFGFYDLRCEETLLAQLDYAKSIGVNALCHWHYWFGGKRALHNPLDKMLELPDNGVKMMLGWANETWTGIWHGLSDQVIFEQTYDRDELNEHAKLIASYVKSDRFLKVNGASPFLIYRPRLIPEAASYLDELREKVRQYDGGDLYIIGNWGPGRIEQVNHPEKFGLDAVVANNVGRYANSALTRIAYTGAWHLVRKMGLGPEIRRYKSTINTVRAAHTVVKGTVHSSVVTGWDNTPRSGRRGLVLTGYDARSFKEAVSTALELEAKNSVKLLFIKSWNEWAEGNTLEPRFNEKWRVGSVLAEALLENVK